MVRLSRKQQYGVSYGMIQCLPPWGSDGAQGMRVTAASSSTGSWAAWGLPVGTGQAMGRGKHHPGWRQWVPGTANQPRWLNPAKGPPTYFFFFGFYRIRSAQVEVSKVARSLATLEPG